MSGLGKNPLAGLAALGLAGAIPTNTGLNPTGEKITILLVSFTLRAIKKATLKISIFFQNVYY